MSDYIFLLESRLSPDQKRVVTRFRLLLPKQTLGFISPVAPCATYWEAFQSGTLTSLSKVMP